VIGESLAVENKRATILLLGSVPIISAVFKEVLEGEGYLVLPASNLADAVDWLGRSTPDLLIVRPYLMNITGHDAALYLRTKCHGLRVLMVSGFLDDDRLQYREALHAIEVFPKPFTAAEFTQKVAGILASRPSESDPAFT
jgi:CheY-like chemotaxis protein